MLKSEWRMQDGVAAQQMQSPNTSGTDFFSKNAHFPDERTTVVQTFCEERFIWRRLNTSLNYTDTLSVIPTFTNCLARWLDGVPPTNQQVTLWVRKGHLREKVPLFITIGDQVRQGREGKA